MASDRPKILVVDDSRLSLAALEEALCNISDHCVVPAHSAREAFAVLGMDPEQPGWSGPGIDLVLMDFIMPDMDGIQACKAIKSVERLRDMPVIVVTGRTDSASLKAAFDAGAMDFIHKPINEVELLARVQSALTLKAEIDRRKARERELISITSRLQEANAELQRISSQDGLTGLANRRLFDTTLDREWRRERRAGRSLAVIMMDLDHFKLYNDRYGHLAGDDCLKRTAAILAQGFQRAGDLVARYGGEEFVALLPETEVDEARDMAEKLRARVEAEGIEHLDSKVKPVVTVSLGVAAMVPRAGARPTDLVEAADEALYQAKKNGRNQVACAP